MFKQQGSAYIKVGMLWMLSIGIVACSPVSKREKTMDEFEPVTGYERSLKFEMGQVKLDVPYGYLFDYSQQRGKYWPVDNNKVKVVDSLNIVVSDKTFLKPYGLETKDLFFKQIDGQESDGIRILIMRAEECKKINVDASIKRTIASGFSSITSTNQDYLAYENTAQNVAYTYQAKYYKETDNFHSVQIDIDRHANLPLTKYDGLVTQCSPNLFIQYFIHFHNYSAPPSLNEVIEINNKVDHLIRSFVVGN